jgi:hypothetical protein
MSYIRNIWYNLLAIKNNIIINFILIGNIIYPSYFNDILLKYKNKGDDYYKFIILLNINNKIFKKYNIDILDKGLELYNKFKTLSLTNINDDNLSEISELSELSDID